MIVARWGARSRAELNDGHLKRSLRVVSPREPGTVQRHCLGTIVVVLIFRTLLLASYKYDRETSCRPDHPADDDRRGGQNCSSSPSSHGRTRMIVFPLIRLVGL